MISIIVAVAENQVIGCANRLIWHISEDLKRFKRLTSGHAVVMGRKTFESLGRPLPNRLNIVVTRSSTDYQVPQGVVVVNSIDQAIEVAGSDPEIFIIGGGEIYAQTIDRADRLYLTRVFQSPQGDTFFPEIDPQKWSCLSKESFDSYEFIDYEKIKK